MKKTKPLLAVKFNFRGAGIHRVGILAALLCFGLGWGFLQQFYLADGPWRWLILLGFPAIASAATYLGVRMIGWLFAGFAGDEPPDSQ